MSKNIVVTGGAGFIGSHLCRRLLEEGEQVLCVDNLFTGRKENIEPLLGNPNFKFLEWDITEPLYLEEVDQIYNLACPASPVHYQYDAIKTIKTNVLGVINMLGLAKKTHARILQASTSEVYGNPTVHPQPENYFGNVNQIGPRACYDEGKRAAETLFFDYHRNHNVDIRVIRIFNTYGPHMDHKDGRVVSNFIVQALQNQEITIYGDGTQTRSLCYISDLIDGMTGIMNLEEEGFTGPVNIGNDHEMSIQELADTIVRLCGSDSRIVYEALPQDDPVRRQPALQLIQSKLGWKAQTSLEDGLKETIDYFRKQLLKEKTDA